MNSGLRDEKIHTIAPNLCLDMGYSLFSWIPSKTTLQKPFPLSFVLQGEEDEGVVSISHWLFWISREFPKALACSFYIIYVILYVKCERDGSVVKCYACNLQDLGSSPRSGKISMLFFKTLFHATLISRYTIIPPSSTCHVCLEVNLKVGSWRIPTPGQMHHMESWKVNRFKA